MSVGNVEIAGLYRPLATWEAAAVAAHSARSINAIGFKSNDCFYAILSATTRYFDWAGVCLNPVTNRKYNVSHKGFVRTQVPLGGKGTDAMLAGSAAPSAAPLGDSFKLGTVEGRSAANSGGQQVMRPVDAGLRESQFVSGDLKKYALMESFAACGALRLSGKGERECYGDL